MSQGHWRRPLAWSAVAHLLLVGLLLYVGKAPHVAIHTLPGEIELDVQLVDHDKPYAPVPMTQHKQASLSRASGQNAAASTRPTQQEAKHDVGVSTTEVRAEDNSNAEATDRLWSLRGHTPTALPGIRVGPGPEAKETLLGPIDPQLPPAVQPPLDRKTVEGRGGVRMHLADDGSILSFENPGPRFNGLGLVFDLTDVVMKAAGQNPYRYEQHRLAEETREERLCRMRDAQKANEQKALLHLDEKLQALWDTPTLAAQQRRKVLFELWDECREQGVDGQIESAVVVRAAIESFIRKHLPKNSILAYSPQELAMLNKQRTSTRPFAPY